MDGGFALWLRNADLITASLLLLFEVQYAELGTAVNAVLSVGAVYAVSTTVY
jgi:hypothetical protein